jgi:hypothetical protein
MLKLFIYLNVITCIISCAKSIHLPNLEGDNLIVKKGQFGGNIAGYSGYNTNALGINAQYGPLKNTAIGINASASNGMKLISGQANFYLNFNLNEKIDSLGRKSLKGNQLALSIGGGYSDIQFENNSFIESLEVYTNGYKSFGMLSFHRYSKFIDYHFGLKYHQLNFQKLNISGKGIINFNDEIQKLINDNTVGTLEYMLRLNMFNRSKNLFMGISGTLYNTHSPNTSFFFMRSVTIFGGYSLNF